MAVEVCLELVHSCRLAHVHRMTSQIWVWIDIMRLVARGLWGQRGQGVQGRGWMQMVSTKHHGQAWLVTAHQC